MNAANPVLALRLPLWRSRMMLALMFAGFMLLIARALYLQGWHNDFLQQKGENRYSRVIELGATRGNITDRHGEILAASTPVKSVWAIPEDLKATRDEVRQLALALDMPLAELDKKLEEAERDFVTLKRQLPPEQADRVTLLNLPGIHQQREYQRFYPAGEVAAHVLGFTGSDERGQEGIELAFQSSLTGKPGSRRVIKDRRGNIVEDVASITAPREGQDLTLSIDSKIQYLAFSQLKAAVEMHKAKAGGIIVLDIRTGEVLALDLAKVRPDTVIQTAPGKFTLGASTISDSHPHGALTVAQVLQKSSNVGTAKLAMQMERQDMWELFHKAGFGVVPQVQFPGAVAGTLRPAKSWRPIEQVTMSYGYGMSASLLQLARAYTVFARDGDIAPVTFLKAGGPVLGVPVISAEAARAVRNMLELAAGPGGTGPRAQVMGYRVAGKTGTAHKQEHGGYADKKYRSSFIGFAPASDPRIVVAVMIDEPSNGKYFGGDVAAPVFSSVVGGTLRQLGVAPDAPMKPIVLPAEGQEPRESI